MIRLHALALLVMLTLATASQACAQDQKDQPTWLRPRDIDTLPSAPADHRIAYGADSLHFGDLRLPRGSGPFPVAIVVHGGCWLSRFATLQNTAAVADTLRNLGIATWNIEYRRVDHPGGGWPGSFADIAWAADHVRELAQRFPLDTTRVVAVGHSAGGHFAFWLAARHRLPVGSPLASGTPLSLAGVVSLGGPPDLAAFEGLDAQVCREPIVARMLGDPAAVRQDRLADASPAARLPLGVPQRLIVGEHDPVVPAAMALDYVTRARALGDDAVYLSVRDAAHFEVIAPTSPAWAVVERSILELLVLPVTRRD
jgi:acetyl esterase/lipase